MRLKEGPASRSSFETPRAVVRAAWSIASVLALLTLPLPASAAVFRPFADSSPWNLPAAEKGYVEQQDPYVEQLGAAGVPLSIEGIPPDTTFGKPIFFAQPDDPTTTSVTLTTSWSPQGDLKWDGGPIPIPAGAAPAPGQDGHLAIVSADQRTAWELWGCTSAGPAGITAAVIAQWDLTGAGYSATMRQNAARGSGTPIVSTAIRAEEALTGIHHAIGLTVPRTASDYVYPVASHSDGLMNPGAIAYGMLFVLRPDFALTPDASIGEQNVVEALKTYGAYVVDQGAEFELDADSTHPELWSETGLAGGGLDRLGILPSDFRLVRTAPSPLVFEGEAMAPSTSTEAIRVMSDPDASGGATASLRQSPTYLSQTYTSPYPADTVTLRMRGDQCEGAPQAVVSVDADPPQTADVSGTSYADYRFALPPEGGGAPGLHVLQVAFPNNFKTDACDRNLYLDTVTVSRVAAPPDSTAPAVPAGLVATPGPAQILVGWLPGAEADLDHYDIYRSTAPGGPYAWINAAPSTASSYDDGGLVAGTAYHYVVRAVDTSGNTSADSPEAQAIPAPPSGYPRPKGASPLHVALVPASRPCLAGESLHGAPLSFPACVVQPASGFLSVGTPDANGAAANSIGFVSYRVRPGSRPDVLIDVDTTDVRCTDAATMACGSANAAAGDDYTGALRATAELRLTDLDNGAGGADAATVENFPIAVGVPCSATVSTASGSTCSVSTSANALEPGFVQGGKRAIWEIAQVKVYDGGSSGSAGAADATLFEDQGLFVP